MLCWGLVHPLNFGLGLGPSWKKSCLWQIGILLDGWHIIPSMVELFPLLPLNLVAGFFLGGGASHAFDKEYAPLLLRIFCHLKPFFNHFLAKLKHLSYSQTLLSQALECPFIMSYWIWTPDWPPKHVHNCVRTYQHFCIIIWIWICQRQILYTTSGINPECSSAQSCLPIIPRLYTVCHSSLPIIAWLPLTETSMVIPILARACGVPAVNCCQWRSGHCSHQSFPSRFLPSSTPTSIQLQLQLENSINFVLVHPPAQNLGVDAFPDPIGHFWTP